MRIARMFRVAVAGLLGACVDESLAPKPDGPAPETRELRIVNERGATIRYVQVVTGIGGPAAGRLAVRPDSNGRLVLPAEVAQKPFMVRALGYKPYRSLVEPVEVTQGVRIVRLQAMVLEIDCVVITASGR